jgi:hypothetical protein
MVLPAEASPDAMALVHQMATDAEARRARADYDTGSVSEDEAYALMVLAEHVMARVVIEVGTFIGTSTTVLSAASTVTALYTCDASNDCLPSDRIIHTYPKQTSIRMLWDLVGKGIVADLCFFDGVLCERDCDLLAKVTHPRTVYAFHDYNYGPKIRQKKGGTTYLETMPRKGIGNVQLLAPRLPQHRLIEPLEGTTLALLVPEVAA